MALLNDHVIAADWPRVIVDGLTFIKEKEGATYAKGVTVTYTDLSPTSEFVLSYADNLIATCWLLAVVLLN